jgi:NAD(P)-dependent dehydrogenase (short-subunit alcohol dehydrogenase family)
MPDGSRSFVRRAFLARPFPGNSTSSQGVHMSDRLIEHREESPLKDISHGRLGSGDDLQGASIFLASDASARVSGHVLVVAGGRTAW